MKRLDKGTRSETMSENEAQKGGSVDVQGNKRESVLKEVWWVVRIIREAKVVGVRVWIMT